MRRLMLSVVCALLLLAGSFGIASAAEQTPAATASGDLVVLDIYQESGTEAVRFVQPESGRTWDWPLKNGEYLFGAVAGPSGIVYAGIGDGRATTVYAVEADSLTGTVPPKRIATVPGRSSVWRLSEDGSHLLVLTFPGKLGEPRGMPTRLMSVSIPAIVRTAPAAIGNDASGGVTAVWYDLVQPAGQPASPTSRHLWQATLRTGQKPALKDTGVESSGYYSVLQAPDGHAVYLIDYFNQKILVVEPGIAGAKRSIIFGYRQFKRPPCAATLSLDGSRLYLLGNAPAGILAYNTHTWRRVALFGYPHLTNPECLGVSPDGQRLFVTSDDVLVTLNATTGKEIDRLTLQGMNADFPAMLVLATSIGA